MFQLPGHLKAVPSDCGRGRLPIHTFRWIAPGQEPVSDPLLFTPR